jgi:lyso-ornithine lipid O-acyltransferase
MRRFDDAAEGISASAGARAVYGVMKLQVWRRNSSELHWEPWADMAVLRLLTIGLTLVFFFGVAVPLQWVALRLRWRWGASIPVMLCRILLRLFRVRLRVSGAPAPDRPRLVAANHISWIDILVLTSVEPLCFLAKREVGAWPFVGAFARLQGTVFVDRARRRSIPAANAAMAARMLEARPVLLFPEGTTGHGLFLRKFHSSHFAAARDLLARAAEVESVVVQPVAISYSSPSAAWVGDAFLLPHVWAVLTGEPLSCDLVLGEPLRYARGADRKLVARSVAARIATMRAAADPLRGEGSAAALAAAPATVTI